MDFQYSTEQDEFRAVLRGFLQRPSAEEYDAALWQRLCGELELPGLHIPAEYGGAGATLVDTAIACTELGRALAPVPFATNAFAVEAILRLGDEEQRKELLADLLSGAQIAAFGAWGPGAASGATVVAERRDGHTLLTGTCTPVLHGHVADVFVVPAVASLGEITAFLVRVDAPGLTVERLPSFDITRPLARLRLSQVPADALRAGRPGGLLPVVDIARVLLAAEMLGGAEACLEMAVQYARQRTQFDRPIGSFQAVKHMCAEMLVEIDATRAAVMFAAMSASSGEELEIAAPLAKAQAADTFVQCAESAIQIHGGIAFTWEHRLHRYFRRAKTTQALFGSSAQHRALLADRAGL
ncbi:acyl-CoA dehydrogenase family protein [Mycobacterium asiaticum]|uniref:Acyl-CoA dehydrogenase n=1 Tax=Mycobacterium asiaticum TaxID=1790 RepID=A0A1A3NKG4_MYCAS|nr:acyl-CoA dehydrogenase family protein [Mycobacterium asiaticum]OBK22311.1 acyl-CoA dehydrogenase [Mycobacterium asiaticum]